MENKSKPSWRYLRYCNHADHPRGQCKEKAVRGTEGKDGNVSFQKLSSGGKKRPV